MFGDIAPTISTKLNAMLSKRMYMPCLKMRKITGFNQNQLT